MTARRAARFRCVRPSGRIRSGRRWAPSSRATARLSQRQRLGLPGHDAADRPQARSLPVHAARPAAERRFGDGVRAAKIRRSSACFIWRFRAPCLRGVGQPGPSWRPALKPPCATEPKTRGFAEWNRPAASRTASS